jgi:hypothetical protein
MSHVNRVLHHTETVFQEIISKTGGIPAVFLGFGW